MAEVPSHFPTTEQSTSPIKPCPTKTKTDSVSIAKPAPPAPVPSSLGAAVTSPSAGTPDGHGDGKPTPAPYHPNAIVANSLQVSTHSRPLSQLFSFTPLSYIISLFLLLNLFPCIDYITISSRKYMILI